MVGEIKNKVFIRELDGKIGKVSVEEVGGRVVFLYEEFFFLYFLVRFCLFFGIA